MTSAVEILDVTKSFGSTRVLRNVDLTVNEHEFVSLLGPSGCGKSTLLRIISGFETPSGGNVRIHGEDVTSLPPDRRPTNMVFQRGALFPHMNVFDNVAYSLRLRGWSKARILTKVEEMLALVRMESYGGRRASELSGGQVQRVALARALASEPRVLLLDEPLSALDLKLRQQMQLELVSIQKQLEATFIFVTHDQTEALAMSDRIAVMNDGVIEQYATPREIYQRPATVFASMFVGETNLLRGVVEANEGRLITVRYGESRLRVEGSDLPADARVVVSVRPEQIRLSTITGQLSGVPGEVTEKIYLGNTVRCGVKMYDESVLWAELRDDEADDLPIGMRVVATWSEKVSQVWQDTDA